MILPRPLPFPLAGRIQFKGKSILSRLSRKYSCSVQKCYDMYLQSWLFRYCRYWQEHSNFGPLHLNILWFNGIIHWKNLSTPPPVNRHTKSTNTDRMSSPNPVFLVIFDPKIRKKSYFCLIDSSYMYRLSILPMGEPRSCGLSHLYFITASCGI